MSAIGNFTDCRTSSQIRRLTYCTGFAHEISESFIPVTICFTAFEEGEEETEESVFDDGK